MEIDCVLWDIILVAPVAQAQMSGVSRICVEFTLCHHPEPLDVARD
jgi:hypothetical protein